MTSKNKTKQQNTPVVIVCGGKAERFGDNKLLADLAGKPLLSHVIERMKVQTDFLALNGDRQILSPFGLEIIEDSIADMGPLAGVLAAMQWAIARGAKRQGCENIVTLSGDTPFVPFDLLSRLSGFEDRISVAKTGDRHHYLCASWPISLAASLSAYLQHSQDKSIRGFLAAQSLRFVDFAADLEIDPFFNINTKDDLSKAEQFLAASNRHMS